ncbi:MAG: alpha/beta hydrolase [Phenylobacterium sp.]|uniref:alpha/beta hydrolase n=1 Tax=Phenylobacterium sp. TaxID=1871053 RepID=UPI001221BE84|nr:alpha/beta hydrolase [Phenylobacterium sp.]TAJ69678.1 MAG: alpha/beta hydrolase [Phenylobacterium sp.]
MIFDRRTLLTLASASAATPALAQAADPTEIVKLWPGKPPGALAAVPRERVLDRVKTSGFQDRIVTGVGEPLMTVFRPARPNGAACLVIPGGAYIRVVIDKEGFEIAHRLAEAGVTSFVLRYRLPAEGWADRADVPLQDAQRAIRLIRAGAGRYGVDPARVAALGCSAGGHVAASLATGHDRTVYPPVDEADRLPARPDLSALLYPVIDMALPHAHVGSRTALLGASPTPAAEAAYSPHRQVTAGTPPTFLVHAADDTSVPVENSLDYLTALRAAKVPAEAHIFEEGGHGFGIYLARGKPAHAWPDLFLAWAARRGWLR